mgnify:CR=1 FL=1
MSWDENKVQTLRDLWGKGKTASQIAQILGEVSRNAVIGKAHRLNLEARATSKKSVQKGNTNKLIFSTESIISEVSMYHKLRPGDIISLGGPGPTTTLKPGDIAEAEIQTIGTLRNPVILEN